MLLLIAVRSKSDIRIHPAQPYVFLNLLLTIQNIYVFMAFLSLFASLLLIFFSRYSTCIFWKGWKWCRTKFIWESMKLFFLALLVKWSNITYFQLLHFFLCLCKHSRRLKSGRDILLFVYNVFCFVQACLLINNVY